MIVLVPPETAVEVREPRALVPAVIAPASRPETVTELATEPVIEPADTVPAPLRTLPVSAPDSVTSPAETLPVRAAAETVPPLTLPVRRFVIVTVPPETLPVRAAALTVPFETAAASVPVTLIVPAEMPPVTAASEPKVVLPAPESEASVTVPVEAVKLRALFAVPAFVMAPEIVSPAPEIVAVAEASRLKVAAAL